MIFIDVKKSLKGVRKNMLLEASFHIKKGQFFSISGESGSGKTTLLRIIAGLEKAKGKITVDNEIWLDAKKTLPPQKREIGFVFQDFALFPNMSVIENLLYVKNDKKFADKLLNLSGLISLKNRMPKNLSGGQKQRVALCRALMRKPKLLLLDEPFSALDTKMRESLQNEIMMFHNEFNLTTIMVSHSPEEIYKLSDIMVELRNGKIVKKGSPKELLLKTSGSEKFSLRGKIIDIIKADIINIALVSIGSHIVEVVISKKEAKKLKKGLNVVLSTKAFHPNIKVLYEDTFS